MDNMTLSNGLESLEKPYGKNPKYMSIYLVKLLKNPMGKIRRNSMIYITPNVIDPLNIFKDIV